VAILNWNPEGYNDWEVMAITGRRMMANGTWEYQVQWAPTWEKASHLTNCKEMVDAFNGGR
jgi:hypothetical protein